MFSKTHFIFCCGLLGCLGNAFDRPVLAAGGSKDEIQKVVFEIHAGVCNDLRQVPNDNPLQDYCHETRGRFLSNHKIVVSQQKFQEMIQQLDTHSRNLYQTARQRGANPEDALAFATLAPKQGRISIQPYLTFKEKVPPEYYQDREQNNQPNYNSGIRIRITM